MPRKISTKYHKRFVNDIREHISLGGSVPSFSGFLFEKYNISVMRDDIEKASNFMELDPNLRDKARLARVVLSNPILKDATLCFSYQKPFDHLLKIPLDNKWWR